MHKTYRVSPELAELHRDVCIVDVPNQFDYRGMVLRAACDLEGAVASLLVSFIRSVNKNLSETRARKEMFSENGLLASLSKLIRLLGFGFSSTAKMSLPVFKSKKYSWHVTNILSLHCLLAPWRSTNKG